jgi:uncharacterized membrane protein
MQSIQLKNFLSSAFGIFMILGGIIHFINPEMYYPFLPDTFPKAFIIYASGVLETAIGVGVFIKRWRVFSIKAIFILMIIFLPLHVIDVFKENSAIGSKLLAYIRLPLQFVLIYWAYFIQEKKRSNFNR